MMESPVRSEEHTSELQSHDNLVCRLLLEKKKSTLVFTAFAEHACCWEKDCLSTNLPVACNFYRPFLFFFLIIRPPPRSTLFPYPTLFRSNDTATTEIKTSCREKCRSRWSPYHFHFTPTSGFWLNLVEVEFGIIERHAI